MKRWISMTALVLSLGLLSGRARADFNLINVNLSPEQRAQNLYGNAYGFQPVQVAPVMGAPAEELPAILQTAQAAGTLPMSVWMLRQAGMNYGQIMQQFAMAPLAGMAQPMTDAFYIDRARRAFLVDTLRVDPVIYPSIPLRGPAFTRFIAYPVHPKMGYWLPPGQAKKYGLWIPPGQAKKMGIWDGHWGHDRWRGWDWDDHDWDGDDHWKDYKKGKGKGKDWDHGPGYSSKGLKDNKGEHGGPSKHDKHGDSKGGGKSKGHGHGKGKH